MSTRNICSQYRNESYLYVFEISPRDEINLKIYNITKTLQSRVSYFETTLTSNDLEINNPQVVLDAEYIPSLLMTAFGKALIPREYAPIPMPALTPLSSAFKFGAPMSVQGNVIRKRFDSPPSPNIRQLPLRDDSSSTPAAPIQPSFIIGPPVTLQAAIDAGLIDPVTGENRFASKNAGKRDPQ